MFLPPQFFITKKQNTYEVPMTSRTLPGITVKMHLHGKVLSVTQPLRINRDITQKLTTQALCEKCLKKDTNTMLGEQYYF